MGVMRKSLISQSMKKGTLRLQDQADAAALRERFNLKDEDR